jgi:hypothetical protein
VASDAGHQASVARRQLTKAWSVELDDGFDSRRVDGDLQLLHRGPPVRTIWVAVWGPPADLDPRDVLQKILEDVHPDPVERFREASDDGEEVRYASWYPERSDRGTQWSLYAYTVRRGSYIQLACLVDDGDEGGRDWALRTWRSLGYAPPDQPA